MTNFTVVWAREAQDQLADLWLESLHRADVTRAAHDVDQRLAMNPLEQGFEAERRPSGRHRCALTDYFYGQAGGPRRRSPARPVGLK
jgi:hypothetical protein